MKLSQETTGRSVLNALVHNDWTITEPQFSMFSDRIEILSHGGLNFSKESVSREMLHKCVSY
jgi:predicted HTH transcriptional regulator